MPGSSTTPGRADTRDDASVSVAFRDSEHVGTRVAQVFAAPWLAYVLPYRRFAATLASGNARLGAGADRYSFTSGHPAVQAALRNHYFDSLGLPRLYVPNPA